MVAQVLAIVELLRAAKFGICCRDSDLAIAYREERALEQVWIVVQLFTFVADDALYSIVTPTKVFKVYFDVGTLV